MLLNLCVEYVRRNFPGRKLGVVHLDYEAQYSQPVISDIIVVDIHAAGSGLYRHEPYDLTVTHTYITTSFGFI